MATCLKYENLNWCNKGTYSVGTSWESDWGPFSDWADPITGRDASSCELCGCKGNIIYFSLKNLNYSLSRGPYTGILCLRVPPA